LNHNCRFGLGRGQIHPDMDPAYLYNDVFWTEPQTVNDQNPPKLSRIEQYHKHLEEIRQVNTRYLNELNGEGSSRTPIIENYPKNNGKRFQPY
jgi:hypothetical protein